MTRLASMEENASRPELISGVRVITGLPVEFVTFPTFLVSPWLKRKVKLL